jgi:hypothetical protein
MLMIQQSKEFDSWSTGLAVFWNTKLIPIGMDN